MISSIYTFIKLIFIDCKGIRFIVLYPPKCSHDCTVKSNVVNISLLNRPVYFMSLWSSKVFYFYIVFFINIMWSCPYWNIVIRPFSFCFPFLKNASVISLMCTFQWCLDDAFLVQSLQPECLCIKIFQVSPLYSRTVIESHGTVNNFVCCINWVSYRLYLYRIVQ